MKNSTEEFILKLKSLKTGDKGNLRKLANRPLDETVDGFDLFAGLWWPLRQKSQFAPRREVAWLIAKLYAFCPVGHEDGATLPHQLGRLPRNPRLQRRFDHMLGLPLMHIEVPLQQFIRTLARNDLPLDWVRLTDDLSRWENSETRLQWAAEYMEQNSQ